MVFKSAMYASPPPTPPVPSRSVFKHAPGIFRTSHSLFFPRKTHSNSHHFQWLPRLCGAVSSTPAGVAFLDSRAPPVFLLLLALYASLRRTGPIGQWEQRNAGGARAGVDDTAPQSLGSHQLGTLLYPEGTSVVLETSNFVLA